MKNIFNTLIIILFVFSCETIEEPYLNGTNSVTPPTTIKKKILIEDFTGHLCPNCPDAARELDAIHDVYGDQIIGMAIHITKAFARPYPSSQSPKFQYDFRTEWGDNWDALFGISLVGLPRGMVNRQGYISDTHKLGKDEWLAVVQSELEKNADLRIEILPAMISQNNGFIDINTTVLNKLTGNYNLTVCLTENNVMNWQKDGNNEVADYIHNHVLKTVILDEKLSNAIEYYQQDLYSKRTNYNIQELEEYNIDYSENIAELGNGNAGNWNINNLSIIAYIYNTTTYEILQVEEAYLIK